MMRKCSVREIENNYSVSHGIVAKLTSAAEFSDAEDLAKQYGGITGYAIFKITDFSYCLRFFTIFCLDKKISPYFPFHNVGRSDIVCGHHITTFFRLQLINICLIYDRPAVLHGPADRIAAVMGMDISFKYFYKMLTDQIPICEQENIR